MLLDLQQIFPRAYGTALTTAVIKAKPEDFVVHETLSFELSGEGEHLYLEIEKRDTNTMWVVEQLAKHFAIKPRDIGYAGLKDRHAVTRQWFSLPTKACSQDKLANFELANTQILQSVLHRAKLRKGAIKHNQFALQLTQIETDQATLTQRLSLIATQGVPNYFDEQRFGRGRHNLTAAQDYFAGQFKPKPAKRRLYISAARSWLFNQVLAKRVEQDCWQQGLAGDVFILEGSKRFFVEPTLDEQIQLRLAQGDIHPSAPLWGKGELDSLNEAKQFELTQLAPWHEWCEKLAGQDLKQQRRATRVIPGNLEHQYDAARHQLAICFTLPSGAYATNLLREVVDITVAGL